jgi:hypothetical protein
MAEEKVFANGFVFKRNDKAPEFVVGGLSVKVTDAVEFLKAHDKNGWVNLNIKKARGGNYYIELDTYVKQATTTNADDDLTSLPF